VRFGRLFVQAGECVYFGRYIAAGITRITPDESPGLRFERITRKYTCGGLNSTPQTTGIALVIGTAVLICTRA
jgi:hypothetical protein